MKRRWQTVLLAAALMMTSVRAARGQDFYELRLRAGQAEYSARENLDAVEDLRIAAFGFLDRPPLLSETLVWLALAQTAAGRGVEADATLERFLEVERLFAPYANVKLDPAVRSQFDALLVKRVARASLESMPGLAGLVETGLQKILKLPPGEQVKALEAARKSDPKNPQWPLALARQSAAGSDWKAATDWSTKTLELAPGNPEALAIRAHALAAQGQYAKALTDLDALPATDLSARPTLLADRFVCLVELKDWPRAEAALKRVPTEQRGRPDVARAEQRLRAEHPPVS